MGALPGRRTRRRGHNLSTQGARTMTMILHLLAQADAVVASTDTPVVEHSRSLSDTGPNPIRLINESLRQNIDLLNHPDALEKVLGQVNIVWAVIFIIVGAMCVLNGYRWHKAVILMLAALAGIWAGMVLGDKI